MNEGGTVARSGSGGDATPVILRHWRDVVPDERLAHLVKDVSRALIKALQARLAEHGVSFGHWSFLRVLWEQDGLTQRELSEQAGVMEPTTFTALKAMERLGYVTRDQMPENRRKVFVHLTPLGRGLRDRLVPLAEMVNQLSLSGVPAADIAATRRTMFAVIENLAADEAAAALQQRRVPSTREMSRRVSNAARR
jgi:DNA-binding MarR family transcriptional regulator